jgi:hypothetical protein
MVKAWVIVILMFLLSLCGVLGWLADFVPYTSFTSTAKTARATAASRSQKPGATILKFDEVRYEFPLRFTTASGRDVLVAAFVPRRVLDKLELEGAVTVHYLPDEPQAVLFDGDIAKMPRGWGSLLFGIAALVVAIGALKIRWTLARHARFLGRGGVDSSIA